MVLAESKVCRGCPFCLGRYTSPSPMADGDTMNCSCGASFTWRRGKAVVQGGHLRSQVPMDHAQADAEAATRTPDHEGVAAMSTLPGKSSPEDVRDLLRGVNDPHVEAAASWRAVAQAYEDYIAGGPIMALLDVIGREYSR